MGLIIYSYNEYFHTWYVRTTLIFPPLSGTCEKHYDLFNTTTPKVLQRQFSSNKCPPPPPHNITHTLHSKCNKNVSCVYTPLQLLQITTTDNSSHRFILTFKMPAQSSC